MPRDPPHPAGRRARRHAHRGRAGAGAHRVADAVVQGLAAPLRRPRGEAVRQRRADHRRAWGQSVLRCRPRERRGRRVGRTGRRDEVASSSITACSRSSARASFSTASLSISRAQARAGRAGMERLVAPQAADRRPTRIRPGGPSRCPRSRLPTASLTIEDRTAASAVTSPKQVRRSRRQCWRSSTRQGLTASGWIMSAFARDSPELFAVRNLTGTIATRDDNLHLDRVALATAETSLSIDGVVEHYLHHACFEADDDRARLAAGDRPHRPGGGGIQPAPRRST